MIKGIEISNAYRKKISVYTYLEDGYTGISTVFDFSNEYTEEIECYFDNRKGVPGVYISKGVLKYVSNEGGKKYIHFNGNKYLVKAVYKDYTLDQNDYRIVIPWNLLNKNEKNYYVNLFVSKIEKLELISLDLESNEDITNDIQLIKNFTEKNNLIINGNVSSEDASSILTHGIILIVMVIFAVINAFTVTGMWIVRRREELMIKKAWGMSEGMIKLENIIKIYNKKEAECIALDGINLEIEEGSMTALMGPSGSGKSTLLNIIGAMDTATKGSYKYNDIEVSALNTSKLNKFRKEHIAFVFQQFALMDKYTVLENVELPLLIRNVPKKERRRKAMEVLTSLGIEKLKNKRPAKLSGGEKQRCAVARAIAADVPLILADEPTGALDSANGENIMEIFTKLNKEGKTIIVVTHDEHVASYCERIIRLKDGKLVD